MVVECYGGRFIETRRGRAVWSAVTRLTVGHGRVEVAEDEVKGRVNEVRIVVDEDEPLPIRHGTVSQLEAGYELHQR